jgi:hypothetical protein
MVDQLEENKSGYFQGTCSGHSSTIGTSDLGRHIELGSRIMLEMGYPLISRLFWNVQMLLVLLSCDIDIQAEVQRSLLATRRRTLIPAPPLW